MSEVKDNKNLSRKEVSYNKLKGLGEEIIEDVIKKDIPSLKVPSRGTSNIVYDDAKRYFVLGDRYGKRSLGNVKQIKKIGQMVQVAISVKILFKEKKQLL